MTTTITDHVARYIETRQALGYRFATNEVLLKSFARFRAPRRLRTPRHAITSAQET